MTKSAMQNLIADKTRRANRRLRDLERSGITSSSNAYRYIERLAYDDDDKNIISFTSTGNIKFRTDTKKMSEKELKQQLKYLDNFLSAKTSTVSGVNRKYKKAYKTFSENENNKVKLSYNEYIDEYDYEELVKYQKIYGSMAMQELVAESGVERAKDIAEKVLKRIEKIGEVSLEDIEKIKSKFKKE